MTGAPIWLTEQDVSDLVSINTGIEALRLQLASEAAGEAKNLDKVLASWEPRSSMHNLGSIDTGRGYGGIKSWINTPKGAQAVYVLFDVLEGKILALMEGGTVGLLRTSGISGLATSVLATPDADAMSIIGTGRQALAQVAAVSTVRALRRIHVYSPTEANKMAFCEKLQSQFAAEIVPETSLENAVGAAPILTLVTRAKEPFLHGAMLRPGTHVNAVGAILPGYAELYQDVFSRFDRVVVDNVANARKGSTELKQQFGEDDGAWSKVQTLGELIHSGSFVYDETKITCFKSMGMGLSDLATAAAAYEQARKAGRGRPMETTQVGSMRWEALVAGDRSDLKAGAR
jgi:ornithine cyclodeaminase/alanine dehydrogenase-like protein (mu-crystallin family)